jgi:hypothetical protein
VYLASKKIDGQLHYVIRESYAQEGIFLSRNLVDLGPDPGCYIVYPGGNAFYIHETIEDRLIEQGAGSKLVELEDIFWRFVKPEIRRVLEPFRSREYRHRLSRKAKTPEIETANQPHIFDRRRVHFLKFGRSDQRNIDRIPQKLFRGLRDKSRDEIEQWFMDMEGELSPREYKLYTYTIFDLQKYFYESFAKSNPQMLRQDKIDEHFVEQICRLNRDPVFWAGMKTTDRLHDYLIRYALMHFDYDYGPGSFLEDYLRQFINDHRRYRSPYKNTAASLKEASTILGESRAALRKMNSKDLTRLYRRKAQELHPDKGGDQDKFVRLTEAYRNLMRSKKKGV